MWQKILTKRVNQIIVSVLLGSVIGTGLAKIIENHEHNMRQKAAFDQCVEERVCVKQGWMGLNEYRDKDYTSAKDSLALFANKNAVAAYYYGLILFNGYGVEQDRERGLEYIKSSAERLYFRALMELSDYYVMTGDFENAIYYAGKYIDCYSSKRYWFSDEDSSYMYKGIWADFIRYEMECYGILFDYYTRISPNLPEALYWIDKHYNNYGQATHLRKFDRAQAFWINGYSLRAKTIMGYLVKKYPNFGGFRYEYALMLLDISNVDDDIDISSLSLRKIQKIERLLVTEMDLMKDYRHNQAQKDCAKLLEKIYRATGYMEAAKNMNHISSDMEIRLMYEKLDK